MVVILDCVWNTLVELLKSPRPVLEHICFLKKRLKDILTSISFEMKCLICENALIYVHNSRCYDPNPLSHTEIL